MVFAYSVTYIIPSIYGIQNGHQFSNGPIFEAVVDEMSSLWKKYLIEHYSILSGIAAIFKINFDKHTTYDPRVIPILPLR